MNCVRPKMKSTTKKVSRPAKRKAGEQSPKKASEAKETSAVEQVEPTTSRSKRVKHELLSQANYIPKFAADRVLSCGEGPQLGHPGRNTTKKPRHVTELPEGLKFSQAVAGGVHSFLLTTDGQVYGCGVNEKGTVPVEDVEREETTDEFKLLQFPDSLKKHGKIVMLAAGASFTAALTENGTVYAWGNLRDASGNIDSHTILQDMQKEPTLINNYKSTHVVKIAAGENHLLMLSNNGEVLSFGDGTQGQLGRTMRTSHIRSNYMVDSSGNARRLVINLREKARKENKAVDIMAGGYWSMVKVEDGRWFAFGLNNYGQLGVPLPKEAEEPSTAGDKMQADETDYHVYLPTLAPEYDGTVHAMGKNTDNALGLDTWTGNDDNDHWRYTSLQKVPVPLAEGDQIVGVTATIGCSIAWTQNGDAYAWGCDTVGQLGLGISDGDVIPSPEKITSAHLEGFKIVSVSIADTHALLLATKREEEDVPLLLLLLFLLNVIADCGCGSRCHEYSYALHCARCCSATVRRRSVRPETSELHVGQNRERLEDDAFYGLFLDLLNRNRRLNPRFYRS
ncbi:hypothetical protein QR680_009539 [Steinernema hermaphroditum]|uniref:RCC1-like domain-containing protein n=1 Tax=Steinernema hermaphroditum TaxID=289476 RepID=A0AA39IKQ4_9BILA|nr:hypothetical protein QR680_009539 [Steinernema hermaphroditum]